MIELQVLVKGVIPYIPIPMKNQSAALAAAK